MRSNYKGVKKECQKPLPRWGGWHALREYPKGVPPRATHHPLCFFRTTTWLFADDATGFSVYSRDGKVEAMKCSFCEQLLICKHCDKPFHPKKSETYAGVYQPDTEVDCPECHKVLACRGCGFVYGGEQDDKDES